MSYVVTTAPTVEPVTVAEAKIHLRVDEQLEDTLVSSLITAAREYVEARSKRVLINTTFRLDLFDFPGGGIRLPMGPLSSVTTVKYIDTADTLQTITSTNYQVDLTPMFGEVIPISSYVWPTVYPQKPNAVQVTFVAGYGAAATSVPASAKVAILLVIGGLYENRESVSPLTLKAVPMAVDSLIATFASPEFH